MLTYPFTVLIERKGTKLLIYGTREARKKENGIAYTSGGSGKKSYTPMLEFAPENYPYRRLYDLPLNYPFCRRIYDIIVPGSDPLKATSTIADEFFVFLPLAP